MAAAYIWSDTEITLAVRRACILEVSAEKPGNVTPTHAFSDMRYEDFVRSAEVIGPVLGQADRLPVGTLVLEAISATRRAVRCNTNLGIVLLLAPLARAAARPGGALRDRLRAVLAELTRADARDVYAAVRLAAPGGMPPESAASVREELPEVDLRAAMAAAAQQPNSVAAEYVNDYALTFELLVPALEEGRTLDLAESEWVVHAYLRLLAAVPDTLIAHKRSHDDAAWVMQQARRVLDLGGLTTPAGRTGLAQFDELLRDAGNSWNPGTSADLVAAGLFVVLLNEMIDSR